MAAGGCRLFGGTDPEALAPLVDGGWATWADTDASDGKQITAQAATVVHAPVERVFATVTDYHLLHRLVSLARPTVVTRRPDGSDDVVFSQGIGLGFIKVALTEHFRLRVQDTRVVCEAYVEGSFSSAVFELECAALEGGSTLFALTFFADMRSLGWLVRLFLNRLPELEPAISANVPLLPVLAMADEAARQAGARPATLGPPRRRLHEAVADGSLAPALQHGQLTVGRLDERGRIMDVTSAARIPAPPQEVWRLLTDPVHRCAYVSVIDSGRLLWQRSDRIAYEYAYRVKLGPLRKRYRVHVEGPYVEGRWLECDRATTDGHPAVYGDWLVPDGAGGCLYTHAYLADLRKDWLSSSFLGRHPELERLICCYAPFIAVRALRSHLGGLRADTP